MELVTSTATIQFVYIATFICLIVFDYQMNEWLILACALFGMWLLLYIAFPWLRREMIWVSLFTMPLGLTEPLFVPEYWSPPSLFNLAAHTGFDIESLIFSFSLGGVASVLYEALTKRRHQHVVELHPATIHWLSISTPLLVFVILYFFTPINPIYSVIVASTLGAFAIMACRPDLTSHIFIGGACFTALYFLSFLLINILFPQFITYWNLSALSGLLILGVPLEEILFAFAIGMLWSGTYEHVAQLSAE